MNRIPTPAVTGWLCAASCLRGTRPVAVRRRFQSGRIEVLLDHFVGAYQYCLRNREAKCLGGFEIHDELEGHRLLDWQVTRVRTFQNPVHVGRRTPEIVG